MSETMAVQEHLYDATLQIKELIDFGIDAQSLASQRTPMPPQGVRFNSAFQGDFIGPKLKGKMVGTDYLLMRADSLGIINVQAVLTTVDGDRIAVHAGGTLARAEQGSSIYQGRENISFHTASAKYSWLNRIQGWAVGTVDMSSGKIVMKVFAA